MIAHYVRIDGDVRDIRAVNTCLLVAQRQLDVRGPKRSGRRPRTVPAGHQTSGGLPSPFLISMQILVTKFEPIQLKYTSVALKKTCSRTV